MCPLPAPESCGGDLLYRYMEQANEVTESVASTPGTPTEAPNTPTEAPTSSDTPRPPDIRPTLLEVAVEDLVFSSDFRGEVPLDDLLQSLPLSGLNTEPIVVRQGDADEKYDIFDGNRRVKAYRKLGWGRIRCRVYEREHIDLAAVAAFHANVARQGLPKSALAREVARYKESYESLHPETKQGKNSKKKSRHDGDSPSVPRYTEAAVKILKMGERSIQRLAAIGKAIPKVWVALDEKRISLVEAEKVAAEKGKGKQEAVLAKFVEDNRRKREQAKSKKDESPSAAPNEGAIVGDGTPDGDATAADKLLATAAGLLERHRGEVIDASIFNALLLRQKALRELVGTMDRRQHSDHQDDGDGADQAATTSDAAAASGAEPAPNGGVH